MKISIAYDSLFGSGKRCMEELAAILLAKGHDTKAYSLRENKHVQLPESDVYVFSTPTHAGTAPFRMKGYLKRFVPPREGAPFALATTRTTPKTKAIARMAEILSGKGMRNSGASVEILVSGGRGGLEDGYRQKLEKFAEDIVNACK